MTLNTRRTFKFIKLSFEQHPFRSASVIVSLIFAGLAESLGLLTFLPLLSLSLKQTNALNLGGADSSINRFFEKAIGMFNLEPTLWIMLILIVTLITVKAVLVLMANVHIGYVTADIITKLRLKVVESLLFSSWKHFTNQAVGRFGNAISSEASRASNAHMAAWNMIASLIQILIFLASAVVISFYITILSGVVGIFIMLILGWATKMSHHYGTAETSLLNSLVARLTDCLQGIKPLKAMGLENRVMPLLRSETNDLNEAHYKQSVASAALGAFPEPIMTFVLAIGVFLVLTYTSVSFDKLIVLALFFNRTVGKFTQFQKHYQTIAMSESAYWSLEKAVETARQNTEVWEGSKKPVLKEFIKFKNIYFDYGLETILNNAEFSIPVNKITALIGQSGSGKTTLADLLCGLYKPKEGAIVIGEDNLQSLDITSWRHIISYVPQDLFIFHGTIFDNVTLDDPTLSEGDVWEALRMSSSEDFVRKLPEGLHTLVGERGLKLSGGQRQRISIARAIIRKPKLLILDEATTALDPKTEKDICAALQKLSKDVTVLAISHQPAIAKIADKVLRITNGQITEEKFQEAV